MTDRSTFLIMIIFLLCFGCKDNDPEPLYSNGMITGVVMTSKSEYLAKVMVTAYGPYGSLTSETGTDGIYKIPEQGNGTYEIEFSHENYATKFRQGVQVFGDDTIQLNTIRLFEKPDYQMPNLFSVMYYSSFPYMSEYSIGMVTDLPKYTTEEMQIRVFINDNEDVSDKNYLYSDQAQAVERSDGSQVMVVLANPQIVNSDGKRLFKTGQTLYLIAYVCSIDESPEFNEFYGLPIYSTVDQQQHSPVIEFKAP